MSPVHCLVPSAPLTCCCPLCLVLCSFESYQAQARLPSIQGTGGVYFAGAWCSYGFHEDGIKSAVAAVGHLGVQVPWEPISTSPKMSLSQIFFFKVFDR